SFNALPNWRSRHGSAQGRLLRRGRGFPQGRRRGPGEDPGGTRGCAKVKSSFFSIMFAVVAVLVMFVVVGLKTKSIPEGRHRSGTATRQEGTSLQTILSTFGEDKAPAKWDAKVRRSRSQPPHWAS